MINTTADEAHVSKKAIDALLRENKRTCSGCYACFNACPSEAITMVLDDEGFCVSRVDPGICVSCGICTEVCPQINSESGNDAAPMCYAVKASEDVLTESSSGGAFTLFAREVLSRGGYVCGAVYDEDMNVVFKITDNEEGLAAMHGSKYIFSDMGTTHKEIKDLVDSGKIVLFSGCPCQVAGLRRFVGDNGNLLTVDLLCGGLPSKGMYRRYLREISEGKKVKEIQFRSKKYPFGTSVIRFEDGSEKVSLSDAYFKAFLGDITKPAACYDCLFAEAPRQGDVSIGDLWSADKIISDTDLSNGISCVMINNRKGMELFELACRNATYLKEIPLSFLKRFNRLKQTRTPPLSRQRFFYLLKRGHPFLKAVDYSLKWKFDVGITGFWRVHNYGGVLTYFALYRLITDMGLEPILIEARNVSKGAPPSPVLLGMKYPFYNVSRYHKDMDDERELNLRVSRFLVGSDQVWNRRFISQSSLECYALDFVSPWRKRISVASSFGSDRFNGSEEEEEKFAELLRRFDFVSVRERTGAELCEKYGVRAEVILDPVMLCDERHYEELISNSKAMFPNNYAFCYGADVSKFKAERIAEEAGCGLIKVERFGMKPTGVTPTPITDVGVVENWIKCLRDSSFVVGDSFHAAAFSILFRKPFAVVYKNRGNESGFDRIKTLLDTFGLNDRLYSSVDDVTYEKMMEPIDYDRVNAILERERERCLDWIKKALLD
ncbi:MAG: polysaccharide pyruvyl transferase family protein [Gudongella sp.]|nr:polysaccharide pyruvyl transferase family protein [Gudongella sp.]